jgi:peptidoglycan/LPS O-acetylase OafA/YrhL
VASSVTYAIEFLVGAACLILAVPLFRRPGTSRWAGAVIGVAGAAAVIHAVVGLLG